MTAPEVYAAIAKEGLTDGNRAVFGALPEDTQAGLLATLRQDFPDIAETLSPSEESAKVAKKKAKE